MKVEYRDSEGEEITDLGTVKAISDPDGDVDDEGCPYGINPKVSVQWDEQENPDDPEHISTFDNGGYMEGPEWVCDEIEVVK